MPVRWETAGPKEEGIGIVNQNEKGVNFTYSAADRREMDAIRAKYLPPGSRPPSNLDRVRKLDARVESKAMIAGLSAGIISTLVMGGGMSLALAYGRMAVGIVVGILGLAGMAAAWPIHHQVLQKEREKAAPEILRLSEE